MADLPEFDPQYEVLDPEELGWVKIGPHMWEKPNGEKFIFPPGERDVIVRLKLPDHPKRQH